MKQTLASGVIPQITAVFGTCGGGLALVPALTDFTFMEGKKAKLFVNAPNALAGNEISRCNTSDAAFQSEEAGLVDFVGEESEILAQIRNLVCMLPSNNEDDNSYVECMDDLNRTDASLAACVGDSSIALSTIADDRLFIEVKAAYAKEMVTGFMKLNGMTVGAVANRSEIYDENGQKTASFDAALSPEGCDKAAEFVNFCDAFNIPVLTLTNVNGFTADKCSEKKNREGCRPPYIRVCQCDGSQGQRGDRHGLRKLLCGDEFQGSRRGYHLLLAGCEDRHHGCPPCGEDHLRRTGSGCGERMREGI